MKEFVHSILIVLGEGLIGIENIFCRYLAIFVIRLIYVTKFSHRYCYTQYCWRARDKSRQTKHEISYKNNDTEIKG